MISVAVALIMFIIILKRKQRIIAIISLLIIIGLLFGSGYFDQFFEIRGNLFGEFFGSGTGREQLIPFGIKLWESSPIFGLGPGSQPIYYGLINNFSHNTLVSSLIEGGLLSFFGVVILIIGLSLNVVKYFKKIYLNSTRSYWPLVFLCSYSSIIVYTVVTSDLLVNNVALFYLAILIGYIKKIEINPVLVEKN